MRRFTIFLFLLAAVLVVGGHAFASTASTEFRNAEADLKKAWEEAQKALSKDLFDRLNNEQQEWLKTGRDYSVAFIMQLGGGYNETEAYSEATTIRASEIRDFIAKADLYVRKPNSYQGLYTFNEKDSDGDSLTGHMELWEREMFKYDVKFDNGAYGGPRGVGITANFDFKGQVIWDTKLTHQEKKITINDDGALMEIIFSGDVADVRVNDKFKEKYPEENGITLEGRYARKGVAPIGVPTEQFLEICKTGTPEQVQSAINLGVEVNAVGEEAHAPLAIAGWYNPNPEVITLLIKAGANLNQEYDDAMTAFLIAATFNPNPEVINAFVKAGVDVNATAMFGQTALMLAAFSNNGEVVEALIRAGADVNAKDEDVDGEKKSERAIDYAERNEKLKGTAAYQKLKELSR